LHARPTGRVAALSGFPRCEALRVRIAVSHFSVSFTVSTDSPGFVFLPEIDPAVQREMLMSHGGRCRFGVEATAPWVFTDGVSMRVGARPSRALPGFAAGTLICGVVCAAYDSQRPAE
jgi:hypothetical protein